mgnify:CR=1 FL=1
MAKYKKIDEIIVEDFVGALFRAIGSGLRKPVLKTLSQKDPKLGNLVKDLEQSREKVDSYIKQKTKKSNLSKAEKQKLSKGEWPF